MGFFKFILSDTFDRALIQYFSQLLFFRRTQLNGRDYCSVFEVDIIFALFSANFT